MLLRRTGNLCQSDFLANLSFARLILLCELQYKWHNSDTLFTQLEVGTKTCVKNSPVSPSPIYNCISTLKSVLNCLFFFPCLFPVKIGLFYIVYYLFLTGYFIAMLFIFYQTLDDHQPKWQGANGIIGDNPGKSLLLPNRIAAVPRGSTYLGLPLLLLK